MKAVRSSLNTEYAIDSRLEQIIEAVIARLEDGEAIDIQAVIAAYPEHAAQIGELLPMVATMARMGEAPAELPGTSVAGLSTAGNGQTEGGQRQLGDFRIVRELGRGGMGVVYEAEQISMGRHVALKVLPFTALVHDKSLQRFRNEVRAAAALDHPHIVSVYSIAEERGVHFYAMQLIRGQTLADMIGLLRKESGVDPAIPADGANQEETVDSALITSPTTHHEEQPRVGTASGTRRAAEAYRARARLGIQAAEALQHAHDQGVLHRDIKPSNLLLDGEGALYVTDFGLARIEAEAGLTMTGDIVGTLRYMAPEQALAKRVVIDHRADIYSLGVTLYELLVLRPAFCEADRSELLKQIAFSEPRPLRKLDRRIPPELETIVLKAIAKNPEERYQTAQQLADDLRAFLEDRPIKAKPPTLVNRAAKWSRRHVAVVWSTAAALLVTTIILTAASLRVTKWYHEAERQREIANLQLIEAQKQERAANTVSKLLLDMLGLANPNTANGKDFTVRQMLDGFTERLGDQLADRREVEAAVRSAVGRAYYGLSYRDRADPQLKAALELRRKALGPNHTSVADSLVDYGLNLVATDRLQSIRLVEEALSIYRANNAPPAVIVHALATLQSLQLWRRHYPEAEARATEAMALIGNLETTENLEAADVLNLLAEGKIQQHDFAQAETLTRQELVLLRRLHAEHDPKTALGLRTLGRTLMAQGKFAEAEEDFREALAIYRLNYSDGWGGAGGVLSELIKVAKAKGNSSEASALLAERIAIQREVVKLRPNDPESHISLGGTLCETGSWEEGIAILRETARLNPTYAQAHFALGQALNKKRISGDAIKAYRETIRLKPSFAEAYAGLGWMYKRNQNLSDAASAFQDAIRVQPEYIDGHRGLAETYRSEDEWDKAIACYREVIRLYPADADAYLQIGKILADSKKDFPAAVAAFHEAVQRNPSDPKIELELGNALWSSGDCETALVSFEHVVAAQPDSAAALQKLAWALATISNAKLRDGKRSVELAQRARRTMTKDARLMDTLAAAYAETGDYASAVKWSEQCLQLTTDEVERSERKKHLDRFTGGKPWREEH